jgi:hypothetical protein
MVIAIWLVKRNLFPSSVFQPMCLCKVSNFGGNNFLFPWETKESSLIIDLAQGNLVAQESWKTQDLLKDFFGFFNGNLCELKL